MQPLAKHQTSPPSWPVLTFGPRDLEENRCLNPCTLITYLVTDPISSLGQLNELPVKCQTSAFICTLPSVYFGLKPRFFNITWHELQLGWKWSRLWTYQCKAGGEGQGMGWGFVRLCWPWGRAFDWSCSPRGGDSSPDVEIFDCRLGRKRLRRNICFPLPRFTHAPYGLKRSRSHGGQWDQAKAEWISRFCLQISFVLACFWSIEPILIN